MARYAVFSEAPPEQVATVRGWGKFGDWVETLPREAVPIHHLWAHGYAVGVDELRASLADFLESHPPDDPNVRSIVAGLIAQCDANRGAPMVAITG